MLPLKTKGGSAMKKDITKLLIIPVDGSKFSLRSLAYIHTLYGAEHNLKITLMHILPSLPPIMVEESIRNRKTAKQLKIIEKKNVDAGHRILEEAQKYLVQKGFPAHALDKRCENKQSGIARDINTCVEKRLADALVISSSGKGRLEGFFMGEVTNKLVEIIRICPVWVIKGNVTHSTVLIAMDGSANSLRGVDHAGLMLSGTRSKIILFHTKRSLNWFFPREVFEGVEGFENTWLQEAGNSVEPSLMKAKDMLIQSGIDASQIEIKLVDGGRSPAKNILQEAKKSKAGTIVLGRRGASDVKDYSMGSITRKVINEAADMAVWIVS